MKLLKFSVEIVELDCRSVLAVAYWLALQQGRDQSSLVGSRQLPNNKAKGKSLRKPELL